MIKSLLAIFIISLISFNTLSYAQSPSVSITGNTHLIVSFQDYSSVNLAYDYSIQTLIEFDVNCFSLPYNSVVEIKVNFSNGIVTTKTMLISGDSTLHQTSGVEFWTNTLNGDTIGYEILVSVSNGLTTQFYNPIGIIIPAFVHVTGSAFIDSNFDCIQQVSEDTISTSSYVNVQCISPIYEIYYTEVYNSSDFSLVVPKGLPITISQSINNTVPITQHYSPVCNNISLIGTIVINNDTNIINPFHIYNFPSDTIIDQSIYIQMNNIQNQGLQVVQATANINFKIINYQTGNIVKVAVDWNDGTLDTITVMDATSIFANYGDFQLSSTHTYNSGCFIVSATLIYNSQTITFENNTHKIVSDGRAYVRTLFYYDANQNCLKDSNENYIITGYYNFTDSVPYQGGWKSYQNSNSYYASSNNTNIYHSGKRTISIDSLELRKYGGAFLSPCQTNNMTLFYNAGDSLYYDFAIGGYDERIFTTLPTISNITECSDSTLFLFNDLQYQCPDIFEDTVNVHFEFGDGNFQNYKLKGYNNITPTNVQDNHVIEQFWARHKYNAVGDYIWKATFYTDSTDFTLGPNLINIKNCGQLEAHAILDVNNNCLEDLGDVEIQGLNFNLSLPQLNLYSSTNSSGIAYFNGFNDSLPYTLSGTSNIGNGFSYSCIPTGAISDTTQSSVQIKKMLLSVNPGINLFSNIQSGFVRPGIIFKPDINVGNLNYTPVFGAILKVLPENGITFTNSFPPPQSFSGDTLIYQINQGLSCGGFANVNYTQMFNIDLEFQTDTNLVVGDSISVETWVSTDSIDINPFNNYSIKTYPVINSYDPNALIVNPMGQTVQGFIPQNSTLTYTILFQNLGNAEAFKVRIIDTLDISKFDISTLVINGASHNYSYNQINNVIIFTFNGINLPDSASDPEGSNGFISFSIKLYPVLNVGDQILNSAYIYFDYNNAVVTNQTLNTITNSVVTNIKKLLKGSNVLQIFPNPAHEIIYIYNLDKNAEVIITDVKGKIVIQNRANVNNEIDIQELKPGLYFIQTITDYENFIGKFIKY